MGFGKTDTIAESPLIYVVIVNWNRAGDTIECLKALTNSDYANYRPLVVDNGSTDGSLEAIRAAFPATEVIGNEDNLGFAPANNIAIEHALRQGADYVLLLNNDTLVDKRLLTELVAVGELDPQIGMLVPKIYYHGEERRLWSAGARWRRFPPRVTIIGFGREEGAAYSARREVDFATGCAMLVKREAFERVGLLDPAFFMYHEDYDFSARVRRGGYRIVYVPQAVMWHKVSASTGEKSPLKWYYLGKYVVPFYLKHCQPPRLSLALFALWVLARETVKGNIQYLVPYLKGLRDGWKEFAAKEPQ
ncbi:MAG: glycosyltransferase family 2 protein [Chloroflexi bacterium]|nr:glycosyltransferase family 2 protein [Chloroflexota bacterium]